MINQSKIKRWKEGEEDYKTDEDDDAQSNSLVVINFAIKSVLLAFGCISKMNKRLRCDTPASTVKLKNPILERKLQCCGCMSGSNSIEAHMETERERRKIVGRCFGQHRRYVMKTPLTLPQEKSWKISGF